MRVAFSEMGALFAKSVDAASEPLLEDEAPTRAAAVDLRRERQESGLTQWELAARTGIPVGTIARWENTGCVPARAVDLLEHALERGRPTRAGDGTRRGVANLTRQARPGHGQRPSTADVVARTSVRLQRSTEQGEDPVSPEEFRAIIDSTGSSYSKLSEALGIGRGRLTGWGAGYVAIPPRYWSKLRAYAQEHQLPEISELTGEGLLDARSALGLSQPELCALAGGGFSDQTISAYERQVREIPRASQCVLRAALERAAGLSDDLPREARVSLLEELSRGARERRIAAAARRRSAIDGADPPLTQRELRDVIRRTGLTHRAFADALGVQKAVVDRWSRGTHAPAPEFWEPIREIGRAAAMTVGTRAIDGEEVRRRRLALGISRPELAHRIGVPLHRVEGWEDKGIRVRPQLWDALSRELRE